MTPLLEVEDLAKSFRITRLGGWLPNRRRLLAVDGVCLQLERGECLAVIGESGSGKSTLARCLVRLLTADRGRVLFDGIDLAKLSGEKLRRIRRRFQLVFQDPAAALDPRYTAGATVEEALRSTGRAAADLDTLRSSYFEEVGLAESLARRLPHQLSGGQRLRVCLARALAAEPELMILDEPVAGLDASLRDQVLESLDRRRARLGTSQILIGHDLTAASHADRVAVMYLGRLVEVGPALEVLTAPRHPYTAALLASRPSIDPLGRRWQPMIGEIPSPETPPEGCAFNPRCARSDGRCRGERPRLEEVGRSRVACFHPVGGEDRRQADSS